MKISNRNVPLVAHKIILEANVDGGRQGGLKKPPCLLCNVAQAGSGQHPATWPSPPVRTGVGACCSRKGVVGRLRFPGVSWVGPGKPSLWGSRQDSSPVLQGQCNTTARAVGLLKDRRADVSTAEKTDCPSQQSTARLQGPRRPLPQSFTQRQVRRLTSPNTVGRLG